MTEVKPPPGSRAILIGVSAYESAKFPPIPAALNSLEAMSDMLTDPGLCGWSSEQVTLFTDPSSAEGLAVQIADLARHTTGALLVYFVGHGTLSDSDELCLAVTTTRQDLASFTSLTWGRLAEALRSSPARTRIVILDCCFAGQAIEALSSDDEVTFADLAHIQGVYTLTATTRNRTAHVPPLEQQTDACTSFTGELREILTSGLPGRPDVLTFGEIYPELRRRLHSKSLPVPNQRGTDGASMFPFARNRADRPQANSLSQAGNGTSSSPTTTRINLSQRGQIKMQPYDPTIGTRTTTPSSSSSAGPGVTSQPDPGTRPVDDGVYPWTRQMNNGFMRGLAALLAIAPIAGAIVLLASPSIRAGASQTSDDMGGYVFFILMCLALGAFWTYGVYIMFTERHEVRVDSAGMTVVAWKSEYRILWDQVHAAVVVDGILIIDTSALTWSQARRLNSRVATGLRLRMMIKERQDLTRVGVCDLRQLKVPSAPLLAVIKRRCGDEVLHEVSAVPLRARDRIKRYEGL
jgi:hypothetical protein